MKQQRILISLSVVLIALTSVFAVSTTGMSYRNVVSQDDDEEVASTIIDDVTDSAQIKQLEQEMLRKSIRKIHLLARTYGDSIVLRWAADDYTSYWYLRKVGVDVMRWEGDAQIPDTIAHALKPLSLEQFKARYSDTDSIALTAMGLLYGEDVDNPKLERKIIPRGSMESVVDKSEDDQFRYGLAVLVSEWRPDIANNMAMRFCDRSVKPGKTYTYTVKVAEPDTTGHFTFVHGNVSDIKNTRYTPEPYNVSLKDSVAGINQFMLSWPMNKFSSFEIERRDNGKGQWKRLTDKPYLQMMAQEVPEDICLFVNNVPEPGEYEYRIFAHDPFGDLAGPSNVLKTRMPDLIPPSPSRVTSIVIDRRDDNDLSKDVFAYIYFQRDTVEKDLVGSIPMYRNKFMKEGEWKKLTENVVAPNDTMCVVDVTGLPTGDLVIASIDTAANVGYSMPVEIRISDLKAPQAPTGLNAKAEIEHGTVTLTWSGHDDDIEYYEVEFVNDLTHKWMQRGTVYGGDTVFVDTLSMNVNQKYIYYRVRGIDYSTNQGDYSEVLQVIRPSLVQPDMPRIDSLWVERSGERRGINMVWIVGDEQITDRHILLRRLQDETEWTTIATFDADSVRHQNDRIRFNDQPAYDRDKKYEYAMISYTVFDIPSEMSLIYSEYWEGELVFDWPIHLEGTYKAEDGETRLAWDMDPNLPYPGKCHYAIWRKGPKDDAPKFLMSAAITDRQFNDYLLSAGEEAQYYIFVQYKDGRKSSPSNIITVKAEK